MTKLFGVNVNFTGRAINQIKPPINKDIKQQNSTSVDKLLKFVTCYLHSGTWPCLNFQTTFIFSTNNPPSQQITPSHSHTPISRVEMSNVKIKAFLTHKT